MPKYYSRPDIYGLRIEVKDQNKWKNIFRRWNQYYVGDIVRLIVYIEQISSTAPDFSRIRVAEKLPSSEKYVWREIGPGGRGFIDIKFAIRGDVLDTSGDDIWRIEFVPKEGKKEGQIEKPIRIFDAGIINRDVRR